MLAFDRIQILFVQKKVFRLQVVLVFSTTITFVSEHSQTPGRFCSDNFHIRRERQNAANTSNANQMAMTSG